MTEPHSDADGGAHLAYFRTVPNNHNPRAIPMDYDRLEYRREKLRFATSVDHTANEELPEFVKGRPYHLPVTLDGVVS